MTTQGAWSILVSNVSQYHRAVVDGGKPLRLFVNILNILGTYNLPDDVMEHLESELVAVYTAATENRPIPTPRAMVIFDVVDGAIVVVSLTSTFARRVFNAA